MGEWHAGRRHGGVEEHVSGAPIEFGVQRLPRRIAEVGARHVAEQQDTVELHHVKRVRELGEDRVNVG